MLLAAEIAWAALLGLMSLLAYPPLLHSFYIRSRTKGTRIRMESTSKNAAVVYPLAAAVFAFTGVSCIVKFVQTGDTYRLVRIVTDLLAAVYFFVLWLNRNCCFLTETHLILPYSATESRSFTYYLTEDRLKLFYNKRPKKSETLLIPGDRASLEKLLREHYVPAEGLLQHMTSDDTAGDQ